MRRIKDVWKKTIMGIRRDKNYIYSSEVASSCHKETKGSKIIFQEQS